MDTQEIPKVRGRRNPVSPSGYHGDDPKDEPQEHGHEEQPWFLPRRRFNARDRDAASQLEKHVRALAAASAEKPRWQKIIEHANSLADEVGTSREEFYAAALIQYIEKRENERISRELNEAYGKIDQDEDLGRVWRITPLTRPSARR
jgi:serine phosphatase RsbU (regulator of sigma subunit)